MSLQKQYDTFHNNIKLTRESSEYKDAKEKDDNILPKIKAKFKENGYTVVDSFTQGSMAFHTGIIPLDGDYDIDRAVVIKEADAPEDPLDPKKTIKEVLSSHGFKEPKVKMPCVTADYSGKPIHIDYVTYSIDEDDEYLIAVGKENSKKENKIWDDTDPKGLIKWVGDNVDHKDFLNTLTDEERRQFRHLVRYIKRWRDHNYSSAVDRKKVYSIGLTVMFREQFAHCVDDEGKRNDHEALKNTIDNILYNAPYFTPMSNGLYDLEVDIPVYPNREIFQKHGTTVGTKLHKKLVKLLESLNKVDEKETLKEKCEILNKVFGDDFPTIDEDDKGKARADAPGIVGVSHGA